MVRKYFYLNLLIMTKLLNQKDSQGYLDFNKSLKDFKYEIFSDRELIDIKDGINKSPILFKGSIPQVLEEKLADIITNIDGPEYKLREKLLQLNENLSNIKLRRPSLKDRITNESNLLNKIITSVLKSVDGSCYKL